MQISLWFQKSDQWLWGGKEEKGRVPKGSKKRLSGMMAGGYVCSLSACSDSFMVFTQVNITMLGPILMGLTRYRDRIRLQGVYWGENQRAKWEKGDRGGWESQQTLVQDTRVRKDGKHEGLGLECNFKKFSKASTVLWSHESCISKE